MVEVGADDGAELPYAGGEPAEVVSVAAELEEGAAWLEVDAMGAE